MSSKHPEHRGSILVEDARVVSHTAWEGGQYVITLDAPRIAARAKAGAFVHLTCDPHLPMRRPLSLQRVDITRGTIEILYKVVGEGTRRLSAARVGETLSCMGPIGNGFAADPQRSRALLVGGGVGLPPMVFLAEALHAAGGHDPIVLLGSEIPFPFDPTLSRHTAAGIPSGVTHAHPELDALGIVSRLSSGAGFDGCYAGYVTDLACEWLQSLGPRDLEQVAIYACGPTPMLRAVARVARRFNVPAQVSLEEYMACAVGGCAGCAVPVTTTEGTYMKRVCVDGPVFNAQEVFPESM
jgi:dihydroorotate dehydrogenase electron transfer subunit